MWFSPSWRSSWLCIGDTGEGSVLRVPFRPFWWWFWTDLPGDRPQAIALTTLVAVDCCVDLYAAYLLAKQFPGWAMVLRLSLSLGYIAQFFLYVAFRKVFPPGYSYWGMDQVYSDPVLYMLIWIVG